jgi:protein-S-isoprenylcysteine O-methyltransferase Ste14
MESNDGAHADVIAPPPVIFLAPLLLGLGLQRLVPLPSGPRVPRRRLGWLLLLGGGTLAFLGWSTMQKAETPVDPYQPVARVVSWGPFARTRNPLYLSFTLMYSGIALVAGSGWAVFFLPGVLTVIQRGVIAREEQYLARKFGEEYARYRRRVPRWL